MADKIQIRRDTAANWTSANPVLAQGELALETDTKKIKAGNGTAAWSALAYYAIEANTDGSITTPKLANEAVTEAKINISNTAVDGYALTAQASASGGLTWAAMAASGVNNIVSSSFESSGTFTATAAGTYIIQLVGAGGGCAIGSNNGSSSVCSMTGGAGGGYSKLKVEMEIGDQLAITIGAGGTIASNERVRYNETRTRTGGAGGNSTCTGSAIGSGNVTVNMAANGGGSGTVSIFSSSSGSSTPRVQTSNAGGTASGGDVNFTGGISRADGNLGAGNGFSQHPGAFSLTANGSGDVKNSAPLGIPATSNYNAAAYLAFCSSKQILEVIPTPFYEGGFINQFTGSSQAFRSPSIYSSLSNVEVRSIPGFTGCGAPAGLSLTSTYMYGAAGGNGFCIITQFGSL